MAALLTWYPGSYISLGLYDFLLCTSRSPYRLFYPDKLAVSFLNYWRILRTPLIFDFFQVCVSRVPRGRKKSVTVVTGLSTFGIDLKVASKFFGTKFACGSSVTGDDEIVIQGDVKDDLYDVIPEKWPEIDEDFIEDLGDQKR